METDKKYDLFVIGAGSGGVRAARLAAQKGAKVAIAENRHLGGTCVNVGCVPKKMFWYASDFSHQLAAARGYGWNISPAEIDWNLFIETKAQEISRLNRVYNDLLIKSGADLLHGQAKIAGPGKVALGGEVYSAEKILIAVGGTPNKPQYPGAEWAITSDEVFSLPELPKKIMIEGGGYIAVEFAGIFTGLACETELVYRGPLFLKGFEADLREQLAEAMREHGVNLRFESEIAHVAKTEEGDLKVTFADGQSTRTDCLLSAIGRNPNIAHLGLENTRVNITKTGSIEVNDVFETAEPGIYALGDVIDRMALTPVALREATALVDHLYEGKAIAIDYSKIPTSVFSQPELACVGLTEEQAREHHSVRVYKSRFKPLKHTISGLGERTFIKLVVEESTEKILGCHMLGEHSAEIMQGLAVAINMGATKADFDRTVGIHPTSAEEWVTLR